MKFSCLESSLVRQAQGLIKTHDLPLRYNIDASLTYHQSPVRDRDERRMQLLMFNERSDIEKISLERNDRKVDTNTIGYQ